METHTHMRSPIINEALSENQLDQSQIIQDCNGFFLWRCLFDRHKLICRTHCISRQSISHKSSTRRTEKYDNDERKPQQQRRKYRLSEKCRN